MRTAVVVALLRWDDGQFEGMWMLRPGIAYHGLGRIRPRLELGYGRHLEIGLTLGLGVEP